MVNVSQCARGKVLPLCKSARFHLALPYSSLISSLRTPDRHHRRRPQRDRRGSGQRHDTRMRLCQALLLARSGSPFARSQEAVVGHVDGRGDGCRGDVKPRQVQDDNTTDDAFRKEGCIWLAGTLSWSFRGRFICLYVYQINLIVSSSLVVELEPSSRMDASWTFLLERQAQNRMYPLVHRHRQSIIKLHSIQLPYRIHVDCIASLTSSQHSAYRRFPVYLSCRAAPLTSPDPLWRGRRRANLSHSTRLYNATTSTPGLDDDLAGSGS